VTNYLNHNVLFESNDKNVSDPKQNASKSNKNPALSTINTNAINKLNGGSVDPINTISSSLSGDKSVVDQHILDSLETLFKNVDKNKSGKVSLTKTKKLFQQINQNFNTAYTSADAKRLFEKCSKNEEGAISLEDFKKEFVTIEPTLYQGNEFE
jgi:Ca2+-binding EF-hand superfamily protein